MAGARVHALGGRNEAVRERGWRLGRVEGRGGRGEGRLV
ncbi:unnamed protein product [Chondrus crispus]|uniref:Uncharacterized protein n=1 Tax=Chondrus crispus TaxID=2769 RepID=R7QGA8_CHOCR|nr:unnamed protein product [Chondrus crispus]CDF37552.1 unnamed protein product [Chondrus crispus]|eukprot:XP_005717423.1 unnamed protein product [Chondrus crispus]